MSEETVESLINELERIRINFWTEEEQIISRIKAIAAADTEVITPALGQHRGPEVGDVIRIKNRRGLPASDVTATVSRVTGDKVQFITQGGVASWRAAKNVTVLSRAPPQHVHRGFDQRKHG